jgi:hypothetical protein
MAMVRLSAVKSALNSSAIPESDKSEILEEVRNAAPIPDTWVYRIVVIALGLAIFAPLIGPLVAPKQDDVIQVLLPIATGALGVLAGLLAPSPAGNG